MTMPPPTPVPKVSRMLLLQPALAPATLSARAAALASLSMKMGLSMYFFISARRGTLTQPKLVQL